MIAVDTNILLYAHKPTAPFHRAARARIAELAEGRAAWAIPLPCVHEFLAVATHPRIFKPPTPVADAVAQVDAWAASPSVALLGEDDGYWRVFSALLRESRATGARVHDARIAALCLAHGARVLWTADRDFSRFPDLVTVNPLLVETAGESAVAYAVSRRRRAGRVAAPRA
jgi:toxin-antitoxin system PIN domain toxin